MARQKLILIACPQYLKLVGGKYECDESGRCPLDKDGNYLLYRVRCDQYGGRCMQTLCVLHRYNRRGAGSWYPDKILAAPEPGTGKKHVVPNKSAGDGPANGPATDIMA